jgi:hypothetical protein
LSSGTASAFLCTGNNKRAFIHGISALATQIFSI